MVINVGFGWWMLNNFDYDIFQTESVLMIADDMNAQWYSGN